MNTYRLVLQVDEDYLVLAIQEALGKSKILSIMPVETVNLTRFKGISGQTLIRQVANDGEAHDFKDFAEAFAQHEFAANSVKAALSKAVNDGVLRRVDMNNYILRLNEGEHAHDAP